MDQGIELFIKDSFIEDKADTLRESFEVFEKCNLEDHEIQFNSILMQESSVDTIELLNDFEQLVVSNLKYILGTYAVKVIDDTPISLMNQICTGLVDTEFYLDGVEILRIIEADLDAEEKLALMLQSVTGIDDQLILAHLSSVSDSLISRVEEVFIRNSFEPQEEIEQRAKEHVVLKEVANVVRFLGADNLIGLNLIKAGVRVNAQFLQYLRYFEKHLDDMKIPELAKELFVLLTMSSDGNKNVLLTYSKHSNVLFHELDKVSKIYSELNNLIASFDRYMLKRSSLAVDNNKDIK